jgi:non-specific serine/threonine protein kinase
LPRDDDSLVRELLGYEAVRLFVERARLVAPAFALTPANAAALARICRRLDGLPLAIELAAARARLLSPEQIAERLDHCFELLSAGGRTAAARHRTLGATIDWSYDLLGEPERALFRRLAVFAGGFDLEAAEGIAEPGPSALDLLDRLVDHSLVVVEPPRGGATRHRLLEPDRQYASEKLHETGESAPAFRRHADLYLALAETAEPRLRGPEQAHWLDRLDGEYDNLRVALERWQSGLVETGVALRLVAALGWFWYVRGHYAEGVAWLNGVLAVATERTLTRARALAALSSLTFRTDPLVARRTLEESLSIGCERQHRPTIAKALADLGALSRAQGDLARARAWLEEAVAISREEGDARSAGWPLAVLAMTSLEQGRVEAAQAEADESLAIHRAADDAWGIEKSLVYRCEVARSQGDLVLARSLGEEALELQRRLDLRGDLAWTLHNLGYVALHLGDRHLAAARFAESLALHRELGVGLGIPYCLVGLAGVAAASAGSYHYAARLLGAAEGLLDREPLKLDLVDQREYDRILAMLKSRLDASSLAQLRLVGRTTSIEETLASDRAPQPGDALRISPGSKLGPPS